MAEALAKMKEEMDRKRKLREESLAAGSEGGGPKKKVYLTKGQLKQLDEKKASGGGAADAGDGADDEALSDSPKKNGLGDASGGVAKKYIPAHEVVRRLRCAANPPFPSQPPPLPPLLLNLHERHCSSCFAFSRHYSLRECNYSLRECAIPASALGSRKCSRADDAAAHFNLALILIAGSPHRPILKQIAMILILIPIAGSSSSRSGHLGRRTRREWRVSDKWRSADPTMITEEGRRTL